MSGAVWRVIGSSVIGSSHEKAGSPCQDSHAFVRWRDDVLIAAVADGAGSAALGEVGSKVAVRAATRALADALDTTGVPPPEAEATWSLLLRDALGTARASLDSDAAQRQIAVRDLATTLLIAVASPETVAAAQVGDGALVAGHDDDRFEALTLPQSGEYINETTFLVSTGWEEQVQLAVRTERPPFLALFTDGLQMLALSMAEREPHRPFFEPLFRFIRGSEDENAAGEQLKAFLTSPRIRGRTDDDLTLLLACRG